MQPIAFEMRAVSGVKKSPSRLTFFLLDKQMGGWGVFFWYATPKELLTALKCDLVGFEEPGDAAEVKNFVNDVSTVIKNTPAAQRLTEEMAGEIDKLLLGTPTSGWYIPFIGTYQDLLVGDSDWVRSLRARFRGKTDAIEPHEESDFATFVMQPFE